jgi:uncharacterized protein
MANISAIRIIFLLLGVCFMLLGLLGAILPVLPTTPFMIIALACFSRSSQRFHNWLYNHPLFGPPLQKWDQHRVISPIAKTMAITAMSISFIYMVFLTDAPLITVICAGLFIVYGGWYILSKPSTPPV